MKQRYYKICAYVLSFIMIITQPVPILHATQVSDEFAEDMEIDIDDPYYNITIEPTEHGEVLADKYQAKEKETVYLTVTPDEGFRLSTISATGAAISATGSAIQVTIEDNRFTMPGSDVTVGSVFEAIPIHTISFDGNGGSLQGDSLVDVYEDELLTKPTNPVRQADGDMYGYQFLGWFLDKECSQLYDFELPVTSDLTLYAGWDAVTEVMVDFNLNTSDPTVSAKPDNQVITYSENKIKSVVAPTWPSTEYDTYEFMGWSLEATIVENPHYWDFDKDTVSEFYTSPTMTLYAQWNVNDLYGKGTIDNPVIISNQMDLEMLREKVNGGIRYTNCYFSLAKDIELSGEWEPIGTKDNPFSGNFNGNGYTIRNVIMGQSNEYGGLFGYVTDAYIENIMVEGSMFGDKAVGSITGFATGQTVIRNCASTASLKSNGFIGGIAGMNEGEAKQENCFFVGHVIEVAEISVGAIAAVGYENNTGCYYQTGSCTNPLDSQFVNERNEESFQNGEVAYFLNIPVDGKHSGIWGQGTNYPMFAKDPSDVIYRVHSNPAIGDGSTLLQKGIYVTGGTEIPINIEMEPTQLLKLLWVVDRDGVKIYSASQSHIKEGILSFTMPYKDVEVHTWFVKRTSDESFDVTLVNEVTQTVVTVKNGGVLPEQLLVKEPNGNITYSFGGWYLDELLENSYDMNTAVTESITLYAEWIASDSVWVEFDCNAEDVLQAPRKRQISLSAVFPQIQSPIRGVHGADGYELEGWYSALVDGIRVEEGKSLGELFPQLVVQDTLRLYARWTAIDLFTTGTKDKPFIIETPEMLKQLMEKVNSGAGYIEGKGTGYRDCYFRLKDSMDLQKWTPIGTSTYPFRGMFDGAGFSLNVQITGNLDYQGIFGYVDYATIENLTVTGSISGKGYIGGVVGCAESNVTIKQCSNKASIKSTGTGCGGIVGQVGKDATILDCNNAGQINGNTAAGGIVGKIADAISEEGAIRRCSNTGKISAGNYTGGVIGQIDSKGLVGDRIQYCSNTGQIESSGAYVGGIVSYLPKGSRITRCYNVGNIISTAKTVSGVGGITGYNYVNKSSAIEVPSSYVVGCYNYGNITATATSKVGAITGYVDTNNSGISNKNQGCYYLNTITADITKLFDYTNATAMSVEQFANGEVAYLLDKGDSFPRLGVWSQKEAYPIFATREYGLVYKIKGSVQANGKLEAKPYGTAGQYTILKVELDPGYAIEKAVVVDSEGHKAIVTVFENTIGFVMPADSVVVDVSTVIAPGQGEYTITFDANGGSPSPPDQVIVAGGRVERPEEPVLEGKRFAGWYSNDELYDFTTIVTKDVHLEATWVDAVEVKVTFRVNRPEDSIGSSDPEEAILQAGELLSRPTDPYWKSESAVFLYEFTGWYTAKNGGEEWDFSMPVTEDMTLYARWEEEDGLEAGKTKETAVAINTAEELAKLADNVNSAKTYRGCYFILGKDINLNEYSSDWESIGFHNNISTPAQLKTRSPQSGSRTFEGNFDGNGHIITLKGDQIYALFGCIGMSGEVANLNVEGVLEPSSARMCFGGVTGFNFGSIINCTSNLSTTDITSKTFKMCAGAISGVSTGLISDCKSTAVVYGGQYTGGIVGLFKYGEVIRCTLASGSELRCEQMSGGIIGCLATCDEYTGLIKECITEKGAIVNSSSTQVGGIVGLATYDIIACENNASVSAKGKVGGIVGDQGMDILTIEASKNTGDILASGAEVGGIIGSATGVNLTQCYDEALISGTSNVGGIIGSSGLLTSIKNCYTIGDIIASSGSAGGIVGSGVVKEIANCYWYGSRLQGTTKGAISPVDQKTNMKNCYYLNKFNDLESVSDPNIGATAKDKSAFIDGELAYMLDYNNDNKVWTVDKAEGKTTFGEPHYGKIETDDSGIIEGGGTFVLQSIVGNIQNGECAYAPAGTRYSLQISLNEYTGESPEGFVLNYIVKEIVLTQGGSERTIGEDNVFLSDDSVSKIKVIIELEQKEKPKPEEPKPEKPKPEEPKPEESKPGEGGGGNGEGGNGNGEGESGNGNGSGEGGSENGSGNGEGGSGENGNGSGESGSEDNGNNDHSDGEDSSGRDEDSNISSGDSTETEGEVSISPDVSDMNDKVNKDIVITKDTYNDEGKNNIEQSAEQDKDVDKTAGSDSSEPGSLASDSDSEGGKESGNEIIIADEVEENIPLMDAKEEKATTVFQVVEDAIKDNPIITIILGLGCFAILSGGAIWKLLEYKKKK